MCRAAPCSLYAVFRLFCSGEYPPNDSEPPKAGASAVQRAGSPYLAEIGTSVVTGFVCVGLFSSPPEASAPCDELLTTAIAGMPIPTTESVCVLLVISPEAKPSREAMP